MKTSRILSKNDNNINIIQILALTLLTTLLTFLIPLNASSAITKPTLQSPANNATITSTSCTFSWSHPYNDQYELKIKTGGGTLKYASGKISAKSLAVNLASIPLTVGSTYKWYVVVYANGQQDSSGDRWFTYNPPTITKPTLGSPANNATITDASYTFSWSHPYNDQYELKIKTEAGTLKYASGRISAKSLAVNLAGIPLTTGSTYKWYVVVYANGLEDSSEDRWFTYNYRPITKPTLDAPANNASITSTSCTFSWSHPYNDQYELKIKDQSGAFKYQSGRISAKSLAVNLASIPLAVGSTYKWYVVVYANGLEDSSEDRWFTYNPPTITKPTLLSPANNASITSTSCTFSWSHPYNDQYELKIKDQTGAFKYQSGPISAKSLTVNLAGIPLAAGSTYKWYVVVYANGLEDSSEDRWFTYNPPTITKPTLLSPANNATITSTSCTFSWSHPYNDQYELKIKTDGGTLKYASGKTSAKSLAVNLASISLTAGSTYKWYVVVYANGLEDSSEDRWFTYKPSITKPTLLSPANNAAITSTSCTFSWSHPYNDQYELKIKTGGGTLKYASGKISAKSITVDLSSIPLTAGSNYKWYVVVYANGLEDSSEDRWFTYQVEVAKKIYGVLIGSEHVTPWGQTKDIIVRCDLGAEKVSNAFRNLPGYDTNHSKILTRKMADGGVKKRDVKLAIDYLKNNILKSGDGLILYINCHGAKYISPSSQATYILCNGSERNICVPGSDTGINIDIINEYPNDYITDNDLKEILSGMDDIQKWIFIDSCHSGGFYNSIHSLMNASLVASTTEDLLSWGYDFSTGMVKGGLFTGAFCDGFSRKNNGKLLMDGYHSTLHPERVYPEDGIVTFEEIVNYIEDYNQKTDVNGKIVYELNIGDPAIFTPDMWTPAGFRTADFVGGLVTNREATMAPILHLLLD
jgi:DNA-directed RNA polymerase subunit L